MEKIGNAEPKYETVDECLKQIEWCNYECEAGKVEMNVAFIQLVKWARERENPAQSVA